MSGRERPDGISPELWAWHLGALDGDPAVCAAEQPHRPGYPCIWNTNTHAEHRDIHGRTWPAGQADEPQFVAVRPADAAQVLLAMNLRLQDVILDRAHPWVIDGKPTHWQAVQLHDGLIIRLTAYIGPPEQEVNGQ